MAEVACIGELFIDLTPQSKANGQWLYAPSPGGAPGNVAVGLAKLGHSVSMISRIGDDAFGMLLIEALQGYGVDTAAVQQARGEKCGLSVVTLDDNGECSFMFYHDKPADLHIDDTAITADTLADVKILHAGILPLSAPVSATAQRKAMDMADAQGVLISCDVNFRPNLWNDPDDMLAAGREMIARAAIVKVSEEELRALDSSREMDEAVSALWHDGLQFFSVTRGAEGAVLFTRDERYDCAGFAVNAVDTTGAGDAYTASILSGLLACVPPEKLLRTACAAGALAATRKGAMESLPTREEVRALVGH